MCLELRSSMIYSFSEAVDACSPGRSEQPRLWSRACFHSSCCTLDVSCQGCQQTSAALFITILFFYLYLPNVVLLRAHAAFFQLGMKFMQPQMSLWAPKLALKLVAISILFNNYFLTRLFMQIPNESQFSSLIIQSHNSSHSHKYILEPFPSLHLYALHLCTQAHPYTWGFSFHINQLQAFLLFLHILFAFSHLQYVTLAPLLSCFHLLLQEDPEMVPEQQREKISASGSPPRWVVARRLLESRCWTSSA